MAAFLDVSLPLNPHSLISQRISSPYQGWQVDAEPGIYLPEFGVRSEIDAYMSETGPYATSPVQREVVLIRGQG